MKIRLASPFLSLILTTIAAPAHDFWVLPDHGAPPGGRIRVVAHTGDRFPTGDSAVALDRIARFDVQGPRGRMEVTGLVAGESATTAEASLREAGSYVFSVEIRPRLIELEAKQFNDYLRSEGLRSILDARAAAGKEKAPGKELYAKYAKAILNLGGMTEARVTNPLGLRLEIVPERNPAAARPGEKLSVRVLFDGKPLPNAQVEATSDYYTGLGGEPEPHDHLFSTRTGLQGVALIPVLHPGNWMIRLVHMIPAAEGKEHEWESFFSTLTYRIPPGQDFPLTVDSIMRGPDLVGHGISPLRWAGDSSRFYFSWRKPGEKEAGTYAVSRDGELRRLSKEEAETVPRFGDTTRDHRKIVYVEDGDIVIQDRVTMEQTRPLRTVESESGARFTSDEKHVTFVRENNLYRMSLETFAIDQLTDIRQGPAPSEKKPTESAKFLEEQQRELFGVVRERVKAKEKADAERKEKEKRKPHYLPGRASISGLLLSPDQSRVVFAQSERAEQATSTIVPDFVTDSGFTRDIRARTKVGDVQGKSRMGIVQVESGEIVWIDHGQKDRDVRLVGAAWSEDGKKLVVTGLSEDNKDRWIFLVDLESGKAKPLDHLRDDAWVSGRGFGGGAVEWMPDGRSVFYVSERDGFFHLFVTDVDGSGTRALTSGSFEVYGPELSEDKTRFYFTSNEAHPGERHFYSMPVSGGERTRITSMTGSNRVMLSPDETAAVLIHSYSNKPPELYLMENRPGAAAKQITVTPTEGWRSFPWVDPQLITFRARDGAEVHARVYTPELLHAARGSRRPVPARADRSRPAGKRPGVLFVHGAGYLQNAHRYWSSYFREYMFHHILMDQGYVVMDIDYRGSAGYGRDWRTGIYRHMGGKDLDDHVDAAKWMVDNLNVDPARIGIYGGSYGGFITLMAMFTRPDVFAAGAALRPVTDWAHYNHPYTSNILNTPRKDAEAYRRSSPIYFAEGLKGALLICHGMLDVNVHFQDTVRLAQRLIELGKENWEVAIYPVEDHGFDRSDSWADEYKRILKLFRTHLGGN